VRSRGAARSAPLLPGCSLALADSAGRARPAPDALPAAVDLLAACRQERTTTSRLFRWPPWDSAACDTGSVEIRPAQAVEVDALRAIVQRAYEGYVTRIGQRPAPMDDDYASRVGKGQVSVAALNGEPVGLIVAVVADDHLLIDNVAVEPAHQGQGVGRALLAHAEQIAARRGLSELRLYTNAAMLENLALYPRLGYREVERRRDEGFDRVFFTKPTPVAD
jgi:ribosomal protein S18 acetylase RimI-like enzyme